MINHSSNVAALVLSELREEFARAQGETGQDFASFANDRVLALPEILRQPLKCIPPTRHAFMFADSSVMTLADAGGETHVDDGQFYKDGAGNIVGIWDGTFAQMEQYLEAVRAHDDLNRTQPFKPPGKSYAELRDELGDGMSLFVQPDGTVIPIPRTMEGLEEAIRHSMTESERMVKELGVEPADLDAELAEHYKLLRTVH